ncbi:MAG: hypothetical protein LC130_25685 [Bryobacterales bacterium]|nr:hypothetical protein [Bryobacterales bacterium]
MKRFLIFLSLVFVLVVSSILFDLSGRGYYIPPVRMVVCHDPGQCLHEIGHASDHAMGWISDSASFRETLFYFTYVDYTLTGESLHPWTSRILFYPCFFSPCLTEKNPTVWGFGTGWGGGRELYADMLLWSDGKPENMPVEFREYFDWDLVSRLIEKYIER